jgi:hypothetical protein
MTMLVATSYFGNRILRHVRVDVRKLRNEGFDILVHTFSENDLRFYRKSVRDIVEVTKETGMAVWIDPWGVGGVFGGEAFSDAALHHRDWLQVAANGDKLPACCPSNTGFRGFIREWTDAALETGADAVFWDEPHFLIDEKERIGCYCKYCQDLAERGQPAIGSFLREVCGRVKSRGTQNVVCVLPSTLKRNDTFQCHEIAGLEGVMNIGSTPFWGMQGADPEKYVTLIGRELIKVASRTRVQTHLWIQGFRISAGREEEIRRAAIAAGQLGIDVIAIWGFDACASMSFLSCERPQMAWSAFLKAIAQLREIRT